MSRFHLLVLSEKNVEYLGQLKVGRVLKGGAVAQGPKALQLDTLFLLEQTTRRQCNNRPKILDFVRYFLEGSSFGDCIKSRLS